MKQKEPLISIIVPIYNVKKYLPRCLDSILAQSYGNTEILLIDDGSTDGSGAIIDAYAKKHNNIIALHQNNGGVSSARNAGVEASSGEWIAFADPDDYVSKEWLRELYRKAEKEGADIATCTFTPFTDDKSPLKKAPTWPSQSMSGRDAINDMMKNKRPAYLWLNLFRASLFKKNHIVFPIGRTYEDIATKVLLMYYAKTIAFINKPLYHYLIHGKSITGAKMTEIKYRDYVGAVADVRNFLERQSDSDFFAYKDYFELCSMFTLLNYFAKEDRLDEALKKKWSIVCRRIRKLFRKTKFPTSKSRIVLLLAMAAATNRRIYTLIYRKAKQ